MEKNLPHGKNLVDKAESIPAIYLLPVLTVLRQHHRAQVTNPCESVVEERENGKYRFQLSFSVKISFFFLQ